MENDLRIDSSRSSSSFESNEGENTPHTAEQKKIIHSEKAKVISEATAAILKCLTNSIENCQFNGKIKEMINQDNIILLAQGTIDQLNKIYQLKNYAFQVEKIKLTSHNNKVEEKTVIEFVMKCKSLENYLINKKDLKKEEFEYLKKWTEEYGNLISKIVKNYKIEIKPVKKTFAKKIFEKFTNQPLLEHTFTQAEMQKKWETVKSSIEEILNNCLVPLKTLGGAFLNRETLSILYYWKWQKLASIVKEAGTLALINNHSDDPRNEIKLLQAYQVLVTNLSNALLEDSAKTSNEIGEIVRGIRKILKEKIGDDEKLIQPYLQAISTSLKKYIIEIEQISLNKQRDFYLHWKKADDYNTLHKKHRERFTSGQKVPLEEQVRALTSGNLRILDEKNILLIDRLKIGQDVPYYKKMKLLDDFLIEAESLITKKVFTNPDTGNEIDTNDKISMLTKFRLFGYDLIKQQINRAESKNPVANSNDLYQNIFFFQKMKELREYLANPRKFKSSDEEFLYQNLIKIVKEITKIEESKLNQFLLNLTFFYNNKNLKEEEGEANTYLFNDENFLTKFRNKLNELLKENESLTQKPISVLEMNALLFDAFASAILQIEKGENLPEEAKAALEYVYQLLKQSNPEIMLYYNLIEIATFLFEFHRILHQSFMKATIEALIALHRYLHPDDDTTIKSLENFMDSTSMDVFLLKNGYVTLEWKTKKQLCYNNRFLTQVVKFEMPPISELRQNKKRVHKITQEFIFEVSPDAKPLLHSEELNVQLAVLSIRHHLITLGFPEDAFSQLIKK